MSYYSRQSLSVSFFHVSLGLPTPRLPSISISHSVLTAPLEHKELILCFLFQYILRAAITMVTVGDMAQIRMTTPAVVVKVSGGYSSGSTSKGGHPCINVLFLIGQETRARKFTS